MRRLEPQAVQLPRKTARLCLVLGLQAASPMTSPEIPRKAQLPSLPLHEGQVARLRGVLKLALQEAMAVGFGLGLGVAAVACGEPLESGGGGGSGGEGGTGTGGTGGAGGFGGFGGSGGARMLSICESAAPALGCDPRQVVPDFARFQPAKHVEHWARGWGHSITFEHGRPCAITEKPTECQAAISEALSRFVRPATPTCEDETCDGGEEFVLARGEEGISIMKTPEELARFLAPIDSVAEAAAVAQLFQHSELQCKDKRSGVSCEGNAFTIVAYRKSCGGDNVWLRVKVPHSGAAPSTEVIESVPSGCAIGRLPDGCVTERPQGHSWSSLADFWSDCAGLEAASVPAFHLLAEDLRRLGAPASLVEAALSSAGDEVIHAALVLELAGRAGAGPQEVSVPARSPKSLFEMAHENAVEGCVRETFGAFVAAYQAQAATDERARAILLRIAEDEMKHAALSHAIAAWAEPQLSEDDRRRIAQDRRQLIIELRQSTAAVHAPEVHRDAGLKTIAPEVVGVGRVRGEHVAEEHALLNVGVAATFERRADSDRRHPVGQLPLCRWTRTWRCTAASGSRR